MLKKLAPLSLLTLAGCDYYEAFDLDMQAIEYRQSCFGSMTNDCVTMRTEYNIQAAEFYKEQLEDEKEWIVSHAGEFVYEKAQGYLDYIIEANEADKPMWFFRWFAGESPVWSPRTHGEYLITQNDLKTAFQELTQLYGVPPTYSPGMALEEPVEDQSSPAPAYAQLESEIDRHIASQESEQSGFEYRDARDVLLGDIDGDGTDEGILLYTLEGAYGGNNVHQRLAVFSMVNLRYVVQAETTVTGASAHVSAYGNDEVSLDALFHSNEDPRCCPSLERQVHYALDNGTLKLIAER